MIEIGKKYKLRDSQFIGEVVGKSDIPSQPFLIRLTYNGKFMSGGTCDENGFRFDSENPNKFDLVEEIKDIFLDDCITYE